MCDPCPQTRPTAPELTPAARAWDGRVVGRLGSRLGHTITCASCSITERVCAPWQRFKKVDGSLDRRPAQAAGRERGEGGRQMLNPRLPRHLRFRLPRQAWRPS